MILVVLRRRLAKGINDSDDLIKEPRSSNAIKIITGEAVGCLAIIDTLYKSSM